MGIVVIGAVFIDIKGFPDGIYIPDGRNSGRIEYIHGGVSRNVVEDIANMELRPTFVSSVDDSPFGMDVMRKLKDHKVNTDYISVVPDSMGTWLAVFDHNGDLAGSISKRPDHSPIMQILEEKGDEIFASADSVILQADLRADIVKRVFKLAKKYNKKMYALVSNMQLATERRDFVQQFDCFICNQREAEQLFIEDYENKTIEELMPLIQKKVKRANISSMVVTLGEKGAVYVDYDGNVGFSPAKKVKVQDTTGAGDAFCAGVVSGLTYGKPLKEAVEIGTVLAASVITSSENVCPRFLPGEFGIMVEE